MDYKLYTTSLVLRNKQTRKIINTTDFAVAKTEDRVKLKFTELSKQLGYDLLEMRITDEAPYYGGY